MRIPLPGRWAEKLPKMIVMIEGLLSRQERPNISQQHPQVAAIIELHPDALITLIGTTQTSQRRPSAKGSDQLSK
jgi:hypothetical protein